VFVFVINRAKILFGYKVNTKVKTHVIVFLLLLPIIVDGIDYSRIQLNRRYNIAISETSRTSLLINKNLDVITNLNLPHNSKFIVAPEPTQNGAFFFLDKEGWTIDKIKDVNNENISALQNKGANFLLLVDQDNLIDHIKFGKTLYEGIDGFKIIKLQSTKPKNNPTSR